ncbi:unnamed protein product, partial [Symbiodinium pilosum]
QLVLETLSRGQLHAHAERLAIASYTAYPGVHRLLMSVDPGDCMRGLATWRGWWWGVKNAQDGIYPSAVFGGPSDDAHLAEWAVLILGEVRRLVCARWDQVL